MTPEQIVAIIAQAGIPAALCIYLVVKVQQTMSDVAVALQHLTDAIEGCPKR